MDEYEYSEGISFKIDQLRHLTTVLDFTQKKGVKGGHTVVSFYRAIENYNLRIVSEIEHSTVEGVFEIRSEIPLKNKLQQYNGKYKLIKEPKTVYDSSIIANDKMMQWGQQAANEGLESAIANGQREFTETIHKINFRIYIDLKTKTVINFLTVFK